MRLIHFTLIVLLHFPILAAGSDLCQEALSSNVGIDPQKFLHPAFGATVRNKEKFNRNLDIIERLRNKQINIPMGKSVEDMLRWASFNGRVGLVDLIVKQQMPIKIINDVSEHGFNSLLLASFAGQSLAVEILVSIFGIDINATDSDGMSSMMWASFKGHKEVVGIVLKQNPDLSLTVGDLTALDLAEVAGNIEIANQIEQHTE